MSNINTGGPAFPGPYANKDGSIEALFKQQGMTLRDYFAAKAMSIALQQHTQTCGAITDWHDIGGSLSCVAGDAYRLADAMLKARGQ